MKLEDSFKSSQDPASCPCPEPQEISQRLPAFCVLEYKVPDADPVIVTDLELNSRRRGNAI
jgi:hypothetical protein